MMVELHRPIRTERVGAAGLDVTVEANAAECAALALRMQVPAVLSLRCRFHLVRLSGETLEARGHLHAQVVQTCVVSLDEFTTAVDETFQVHFVPAGTETDDPDPESVDEIGYANDVLDLGEAAAEQLGLALDPYPRRPDAELPAFEAEEEQGPFAALRGLPRH